MRIATPMSGLRQKQILVAIFYKHIFTLVALYVSIFAEIPLTPHLLLNETMAISS